MNSITIISTSMTLVAFGSTLDSIADTNNTFNDLFTANTTTTTGVFNLCQATFYIFLGGASFHFSTDIVCATFRATLKVVNFDRVATLDITTVYTYTSFYIVCATFRPTS